VPHKITTATELAALIDAGEGLIYNVDGKKLHAITCEWVPGMSLGTTKYHLDAAEAPAFITAHGARPCPVCLTGGAHGAVARPRAAATLPPAARAAVAPAAARDDEHCEFTISARQITAWTDEHVPLSAKTPTAKRVRSTVGLATPGFVAGDHEILHATFVGPKPIQPGWRVSDADIENLLLYNFAGGIFDRATVHGLRIEHDPAPPAPAPSGVRYRIALNYRLADADEPWAHWKPVRQLVDWEPVSLGAFAGEKRLAQVWWALRQARPIPAGVPRADGEPYAVLARIHPPAHLRGRWLANRVKGTLDGIVCAFQAQRDRGSAGEYARRVNADLRVGADAIAAALLEDEHAVLGAVDQLLCRHGERGVRWLPADHDLVLADLRPGPPLGAHWALSGEIHTVTRDADARA
jgi:hypothetical protein